MLPKKPRKFILEVFHQVMSQTLLIYPLIFMFLNKEIVCSEYKQYTPLGYFIGCIPPKAIIKAWMNVGLEPHAWNCQTKWCLTKSIFLFYFQNQAASDEIVSHRPLVCHNTLNIFSCGVENSTEKTAHISFSCVGWIPSPHHASMGLFVSYFQAHWQFYLLLSLSALIRALNRESIYPRASRNMVMFLWVTRYLGRQFITFTWLVLARNVKSPDNRIRDSHLMASLEVLQPQGPKLLQLLSPLKLIPKPMQARYRWFGINSRQGNLCGPKYMESFRSNQTILELEQPNFPLQP